jgi:adenine-specific DNA-methyltransferase
MKSPIVSPNYRENLCYDYKGYKHPPNGWSISQDIMEEWDRNGKLYFPKRGERIYRKIYLDEYPGQPIQNLWLDIFVINPMAHERVEFSTQKPISLIKRMMLMTSDKRSCVLDFFAGSGTTGHAVINLNREDGGTRKYFLVEVGAHFDTVLKPRLQRVVYSDVWRDGKPVSRTQGLSHCFKYIRLESYEDALNNLSVKRSQQQDLQLEHDDDLREQYILSYMLDVECRGSQSLLNVESFRDPDQYKLRIDRNGETQLVNVDLIETFNWLLGLTVKHISVVPLKKGQTGVRVVEGMNLDGDRVLVLWRNLDETDNDTLDEWFKKQDYNTKDQEYDLIYVNGDNNLENLRRGDQTWKVRLIEEEFQQLMFDVEDV